eukprot:PhM_4_TR17859/c1_g1_i2/m.14148
MSQPHATITPSTRLSGKAAPRPRPVGPEDPELKVHFNVSTTDGTTKMYRIGHASPFAQLLRLLGHGDLYHGETKLEPHHTSADMGFQRGRAHAVSVRFVPEEEVAPAPEPAMSSSTGGPNPVGVWEPEPSPVTLETRLSREEQRRALELVARRAGHQDVPAATPAPSAAPVVHVSSSSPEQRFADAGGRWPSRSMSSAAHPPPPPPPPPPSRIPSTAAGPQPASLPLLPQLQQSAIPRKSQPHAAAPRRSLSTAPVMDTTSNMNGAAAAGGAGPHRVSSASVPAATNNNNNNNNNNN